MKGAVDLNFSSEAEHQLQALGRVARRLLPVVIRDQLVGSSGGPELTVIPEHNIAEAVPESELDAGLIDDSASRWYALRLMDDYTAIVRPFVDEGEITGARVAQILSSDQADEFLNRAAQSDTAAPAGSNEPPATATTSS